MPANRVILITAYDPNDVSKWSGTIFSIFNALKAARGTAKIEYIRGALGVVDFVARAVNRALRTMGIRLDCRFSTAYAVISGACLTVRLLFAKRGTLLAIAASNYVPYIITTRDIIYVSDGTFRLICDLYPDFQKFPKWLQVQGERNEARSLSKARSVLYPSRWAAESAKAHYGVAAERIFQIPFGPNIPDEVINKYYVRKSITRAREIKLIFISADWGRKDGDKALEIASLLRASGLNIKLIIIGDAPKRVRDLDFVENRGFLNKSNPDDLTRLCLAFQEAHFLLLPTRADASPIVFSEAQAFGVPPVTYDVGGTASSIVHRETGLLMPAGAQASSFVEQIMQYANDPDLYDKLSERCRERYLNYANWSSWATLILELANERSLSVEEQHRRKGSRATI